VPDERHSKPQSSVREIKGLRQNGEWLVGTHCERGLGVAGMSGWEGAGGGDAMESSVMWKDRGVTYMVYGRKG